MASRRHKSRAQQGPIMGAAWLPEVGENLDPKSQYYKRHVIPVDHGWAWVICFAGFLVYFVFGIATQVLVVLLTEISDYFDASLTAVSLIFTFAVFSVGFMSILSTNVLAPRFGERAVVTTAGVFNMFGSLGLAFSPTIHYFLMCSVVKGLATGAVFVPSISLLRIYFTKKRSIALIMANVGQSAAIIVSPYIITLIREEYGLPGTFIVCAGFELHMCVAGLLLRPISAYTYRPHVDQQTETQTLQHVLVSEDFNELTFQKKHKNAARNLKLLKLRLALDRFAAPTTQIEESHSQTSADAPQPSSSIAKIFLQNKSVTPPVEETDGELPANPENLATSPNLNENADNNFDPKLHPGDEEVEMRRFKQQRKFRKCLFKWIILANITASANLYIRSYIPTIMQDQGATVQQSALLLTLSGTVDLLSRLGVGVFADTHILSAAQITIISQICLAVVCHCIHFFRNPPFMWIVYVVLQGLFIGTRVSMLPMLIMEVMGVERMPQCMAIVSTAGALATAPMHPMFGAITEATGNFYAALHIMGGCFTFAAIVLLIMPYLTTALCGAFPPDPEPEGAVNQVVQIKEEQAVRCLYNEKPKAVQAKGTRETIV